MKSTKKILLSLGVITVFIVYGFQQRNDQSAPVVAPTTSAPTPTSSVAAIIPASPVTAVTNTGQYKDGSYVGSEADAFYGTIQVKAIISGGKITDVQFLQYPNDRRNSVEINKQAMPYLKQEAIKAQNSQVNTITGASDTSQAFVQSLFDALTQAKQV